MSNGVAQILENSRYQTGLILNYLNKGLEQGMARIFGKNA